MANGNICGGIRHQDLSPCFFILVTVKNIMFNDFPFSTWQFALSVKVVLNTIKPGILVAIQDRFGLFFFHSGVMPLIFFVGFCSILQFPISKIIWNLYTRSVVHGWKNTIECIDLTCIWHKITVDEVKGLLMRKVKLAISKLWYTCTVASRLMYVIYWTSNNF